MKKCNFVNGYEYTLEKEDLMELPEFKNFTEFDYIEMRPSIMVLKTGGRTYKSFKVFAQISNYSKQIMFLPVSNCTSVRLPNMEFSLPYEESFEGVAHYVAKFVKSGAYDWTDLIECCKSHSESFEDFVMRKSSELGLNQFTEI